MNFVQILNLVTSLLLLYPSVKLSYIAIRGLVEKQTRRTSSGLILLFMAFGVASFINSLLYTAILLNSLSGQSISDIAASRVLVQNILLLMASYILMQVSRNRV